MSIIPQPSVPKDGALMNEIQAEVSTEAAPLLQFIVKRIFVIVSALIIFIAAIIGTGLYQWYTSNQEEKAALEVGRILTSTNGADRVKALEALSGKVPSEMQEGLNLELAIASYNANDLEKAANYYGLVAKGNTVMAVTAALDQAQILLKLKKTEEAFKVLEASKNTSITQLKPLVLESLAICAEEANKLPEAVKAYEDIIAFDLSTPSASKTIAPQEIEYFKARIKALQDKIKK